MRSGSERAPGELAHDRDEERPDQHEDLGDDEQLDVPPEAVEQRGASSPDEVPLEQHGANARVVSRRGRTRRTATIGGDETEPDHVEQVVAGVLGRRCGRRGAGRRRRAGGRGGCGSIARAPYAGTIKRRDAEHDLDRRARSADPGAPISSDWWNARSPAQVSSGQRRRRATSRDRPHARCRA